MPFIVPVAGQEPCEVKHMYGFDSKATFAARERVSLPPVKVISSEIACAVPVRIELVVAHYDRRHGDAEYLLLYLKSSKHYDIYQSLSDFPPEFWESGTADTVIRVDVERKNDRRKVAHLVNNYYENHTLTFRHLQGQTIGAVPIKSPSGKRQIAFVCPIGTVQQASLTPDMVFV